jgi:hypothetical protein
LTQASSASREAIRVMPISSPEAGQRQRREAAADVRLDGDKVTVCDEHDPDPRGPCRCLGFALPRPSANVRKR